jgi:hypothetical protein
MKGNPSATRFDRLAENFATSEVHRSSPTIHRSYTQTAEVEVSVATERSYNRCLRQPV